MGTLMLDFLETAKAKVETIQATLRHRQQPQDVTFHLCLKALRDAIDMASGPAGREEVIEECIQAVENVFLAMACTDVHLMRFIREHLRALKAPSP